jgi:peptidyl-prolyl cis-trans isomerase D
MAVLQNIRNKAGALIIVFVGIALFLFIIDPSTFNGLFNKQEKNVAKINGENVSYELFSNNLKEVTNFVKQAQQTNSIDAETSVQLKEQVWQEIIMQYLLSDTYKDLGLDVSDSEMEDMLWGTHIHPIIQNNFTNPQTGAIDTTYVRQFFESSDLDSRYEIISDYLKEQIAFDRTNNKYQSLIEQGLYTPTVLAKADYLNSNSNVDFAYIAMRYKDIVDEDIELDEKDLTSYYEEHKYMFENDANEREIEYLNYYILPNAEDSTVTKSEIEELRSRFGASENDMDFVITHSDKTNYNPYFTEANVPAGYGKSVFENKTPGFISGVYTQDTSFNIFKVVEFVSVPDSVKASHILITPDSTRNYEETLAFVDSLKQEVENGSDFEELAKTYSMGPSSSKGGDLGWFKQGSMVQEFNNACFYNASEKLQVVTTKFGVHLISINKLSNSTDMVKLAVVNKHIDAGSDTYQKLFADASQFASNNNTAESFDKAVIDDHLVKRIASGIKENDQDINGLEDSREIIKWAYSAESGEISDVFEIRSENCFVVAKLSEIREKGTAPFEQVRSQIEPIVKMKKKASIINEKVENAMASTNDLATIAKNLNTRIDTAKNISFNSFSIPRLGIEPKVISTATCMTTDISKPIEGNNAIYIVKTVNKTEAKTTDNYAMQQKQLSSVLKSRVGYEMLKAIQSASDIEDNRTIFF